MENKRKSFIEGNLSIFLNKRIKDEDGTGQPTNTPLRLSTATSTASPPMSTAAHVTSTTMTSTSISEHSTSTAVSMISIVTPVTFTAAPASTVAVLVNSLTNAMPSTFVTAPSITAPLMSIIAPLTSKIAPLVVNTVPLMSTAEPATSNAKHTTSSTAVPLISTSATSSAIDHNNKVFSLCYSKLEPPAHPSSEFFTSTKGWQFNVDFYNQFSWLEYNETQDNVYCYACRHFGFNLARPGDTFGKQYSIDCRFLTSNNSSELFIKHQCSKHHQTCMDSWTNFKSIQQKEKLISSLMKRPETVEVEETPERIKNLLGITSFLGQQGLPLHGHDKTLESTNEVIMESKEEQFLSPNDRLMKIEMNNKAIRNPEAAVMSMEVGRESMDSDEEILTPQAGVSEQTEGMTHKARLYQLELYEQAVDKNSILVLGTGSGKTFIAMLLIKHMAQQLAGKVSEGAKRTVMIANTVPLVRQQAKAIGQLTPYTVSSYDGSTGVDYWDKAKWEKQLETNEVLVMVAQIFLDMLNHNHIKFSQVNLLIVDECHHATGNHPMREIMRRYSSEKRNNSPLPRVLGLTASIIQKKCKKHEIPKLLFELEACLNSSLVTSVHYEEVLKHTTKPLIVYLDYCNDEKDLSDHAEGLICQLNSLEMYIEREKIDQKSKKALCRVFRNIGFALNDLGEWCGSRAINFEVEHFNDLVSQEKEPQLSALLTLLQDKLLQMSAVCVAHEQSFAEPRQHVTNHVSRLLDVILRALRSPDSLILVFVKTRFTAFLLRDLVNELQKKDPKFKDALAQTIVGSNTNNPMGDLAKAKELFRKQTDTLEAFRRREFRILFSTSVLEEGVDVRKCNVVVRYDEPVNFRAYVQSKGRARADKSVYVLMMAPDSKLPEEVAMYQQLELDIRNICHDRAMPKDEEIAEAFGDDIIEPYMPYGCNGPRITSHSSYNVLNRYCGKLPKDKFTTLVPQYKVTKDEETFTATLSLPLDDTLRLSVTGDAMVNADWAKKSASLKMCQILHERGKLDDRLLPNTDGKVVKSLLKPALGDQTGEDIVSGKPGSEMRSQVFS